MVFIAYVDVNSTAIYNCSNHGLLYIDNFLNKPAQCTNYLNSYFWVSLSQNNMNIDCLKILMFTLWQSAKSKRLLPLCSKYIKLSNIISEHGTILDFFFLFCETFLSTRFPCVWCSLVNTIYNWHFKSSPERSAYFWATSRSCCLFIILFENVFSSRM